MNKEANDPELHADDCQPLRQAVAQKAVHMAARVRGQYPGTPLAKDQLPKLRTIGYWDAVGPQDWGLPAHRNEGIEICYLLSGHTAFATDDEEVILRPGDITITRPWQSHRLGNPHIGPCRLFWVILDVETQGGRNPWQFPDWIGPDLESRKELLRIIRANPRCHLHDEGQLLKEHLQSTCRLLDNSNPLEAAHLAGTVNHLLLTVANILACGAGSSPQDPHGYGRTVRGFFQGLEANRESAAEAWTVAGMAHACRVGVTYLNSACRELFNTTPSQHLCRIRLSHAATMLREHPDQTVTEIAFASGFNSSQHFATRFRRQYGRTPVEHRYKTR